MAAYFSDIKAGLKSAPGSNTDGVHYGFSKFRISCLHPSSIPQAQFALTFFPRHRRADCLAGTTTTDYYETKPKKQNVLCGSQNTSI